MTLYVIAGLCVFLTSFVAVCLIVAYCAGRNKVRLLSEQKNTADATQSAEAASQMLKARTNGIRSDDELLSTLDKGKF